MTDEVLQIFRGYQTELDAKHDKYEKLVKKGRDITIESKRIIFLLHRIIRNEGSDKVLCEAVHRLSDLHSAITIGIGSLLVGEDIFHYLRAFTPGLQEYVEALSFYHYLKHGKLICIEEIYQATFLSDRANVQVNELENMCGNEKLPISALLTPLEYVLGVADLTGELMRKCITAVGCGGLEEPFHLRLLLQNIYDAFLVIGNLGGRELSRKTTVLKTSLDKVENACYAIKVRGSETPKHSLAYFFSGRQDMGNEIECEM